MGEINIPRDQQTAITAIDARELDRLIDQAIREERSGELHRLLSRPAAPTSEQSSIPSTGRWRNTARPRRRESGRKRDALRRAGHDLSFAVGAMKQRLETEQKDAQLFIVDDQIVPPYRFTTQMSVRVSYRWRRTIEDEWQWGSITFVHHHDPRPNYAVPVSTRKPSAAKQEQELQNRLYQTWEHLMRGALYSVRDYFRDGGDGAKIQRRSR
jgi:hypothetical protein